ncbi:MAG TPA: hypothetical protein VEC12_04850 [Bacteroidia bacterium]|nr:hypothetical protein [Bacteroidia bacterium]
MRFAVNKDVKSFRQYLQFFNRTEWIDDEYWILGASVESANGELLAYGVLYFNNGHQVNNLSASCLGNFYASNSEAATILLNRIFEISVKIAPVIIGPINGSTWSSYRFITEFHTEPFYLEPANPPEYNRYFKASGFTDLSGYCSSVINNAGGFLPSSHIGNLDYAFKNFDADTFDDEIKKIHLISNTAFKNNFLFTEINYNKF